MQTVEDVWTEYIYVQTSGTLKWTKVKRIDLNTYFKKCLN